MHGFLALFFLLNAFDPAATLRALPHEEARPGAIRQVLRLKGEEFEKAFSDRTLVSMLGLISADPQIDFLSRVLAIRAVERLKGVEAEAQLRSLLQGEDPEGQALSREAAQCLARLNCQEALAEGAQSSDPETRAIAFRSADLPVERLCQALSDPWPDVRQAAAQSLGRSESRGCLSVALKDRDASVRRAAADAAGGFSDVKLGIVEADQPSAQTLIPLLEARLADRREAMAVRSAALIALGRLGETARAQKVLETHLSKGGLVDLSEAAVFALAQGEDSKENAALIEQAVASSENQVAFAALRAIHAKNPARAIELYRAHRPKLTSSQFDLLKRWAELQAPARKIEEYDEKAGFVDGKPVEDDPEDWDD